MKSSLRLFRIAGIDIGIHYTWIFIFILISWTLAAGVFPAQHPNQSAALYWANGHRYGAAPVRLGAARTSWPTPWWPSPAA